jgi:voltage-gated potassium channel
MDAHLRKRLHDIIFEADSPVGKWFDIILLILIMLSVITVAAETIPGLSEKYGKIFFVLEWFFTVLFTLEYILRIYTVDNPKKYITSFYGLVDLFSILPTYLSLIVVGTHSLVIIRLLRLLRVFRIFKMGQFMKQGDMIIKALRASYTKITIFLYFIVLIVCIFGAVMYVVEGSTNPGFDSIPRSIYWSIVTLTTVGFGDIIPKSTLGQFLSAVLMVLGYAVIAVPTGIVSSEMIKTKDFSKMSTQHCSNCSCEDHDIDAKYCKICGKLLNPDIIVSK